MKVAKMQKQRQKKAISVISDCQQEGVALLSTHLSLLGFLLFALSLFVILY